MKRDGRTLDHTTLEEMRLLAVQRMAEGESAARVAASFGLHRGRSCRAAAGGVAACGSALAQGEGTAADVGAERQVPLGQRQEPDAVRLDFGLWTRQIVRNWSVSDSACT